MSNRIPHFKTHICYVSAESMPNVLLCLDENTKPENVILLTSSQMIKNGKYNMLAQNFRNLGVKVEKKELVDISLFALQDFIEQFINSLPAEAISEYAFNITGGTKLMTAAAIRACSKVIEMFYVDTFNNTLFLLNEKKEIPLPNLCTVQNILNSYGFRIFNKRQQNLNNGKMIQTLLNQPVGIIKMLNALSAQAEKTKTAELIQKNSQLDSLLAKCEEAKLLARQGDTILFADEESRSFCNGIWLEEHVHHALDQLKRHGEITDYEGAVNIIYADRVVSNAEAKPDNELDALFVKNNILYLVECKTCKMDNDEKARDIVYKLDSLHNKIGGVFAHGILISLEKLSENEKKHAQKNNLIVIDDMRKIKDLRKTFIEILEHERKIK